MKNSRPKQVAVLIGQPSLDGHFLVMLDGVIEPQLTMGKTLTALIHHNRGDVGEIIQE